MASHASPTRIPAESDRAALTLGVVVAVIGLPVAVAFALSWFDFAGFTSSRPVPLWVTPEIVRATTADGNAVRARVAIDAARPSTKAAIERRYQQVGVLLTLSAESHSRTRFSGPAGIEHLATDMRQRVNSYLAAESVEPVAAVAVQDLLFTKR